jgi:PadR family transcriptional regulator, regulatory protein PadR
MIASAAEQALVPSATGFHVGYCDQGLRTHPSRISIPGTYLTCVAASCRIVGKLDIKSEWALFPLAYREKRLYTHSNINMSRPSDLVQGTLDLLLLKILALEPMHGWAITLRLKSISGGVLQVSEGSLYPALHKLEQEGWIRAEWKQTENNRRAKFYSLTRLGTKQLEAEAAHWHRLSSAISHVVQLAEA